MQRSLWVVLVVASMLSMACSTGLCADNIDSEAVASVNTDADPQPTDPFLRILDRAVEAMDESYDGWQHRRDETVDSTTFTINYSASLSTEGRRRLDRVLILHADQNRDRKVTREEAIRFLESQLGIRWITGDLLRKPDGRVVDFAEFLRCDINHDDALTKKEFVDTWWNSATAEQDFEDFDLDRDGMITLAEFSKPSGRYLFDPIKTFRDADVNKDGGVDAKELKTVIPSERSHLIESNLLAFDDDDNDLLSLSEFRVSMLGNFNFPWDVLPKDKDRDGSLSFAEFRFHTRDLFQLQRRYYFHRLDRDGDHILDPSEFEFQQYKLHSLYRVSVDGEDSRQLYQHKDFPAVGSPSVSRDGHWILFDATPPEGPSQAQILLMNSEGEDVRDICDGLMPSWSNNGSQFACCRYEGGASVWIMNTDGTAQERIGDGWSAQWSPDGKSIAYTNDNSIRVYDVATKKSRTVLPKGSHPYQYIYWNMAWSPDSRRLAFRGKLENQQEIAMLSISDGQVVTSLFGSSEKMGDDLAWSPDGERILFNLFSHRHQRELIFGIEVDSKNPPRVVQEISTALSWNSVCFAPDGKWMVLATSN